MSRCDAQTLSVVTSEYLSNRMIDGKKNFASYLIIAKRVWQDLFWNTIWSTQSSWESLLSGTPYNYILLPNDCSRFFTASVEDCLGKIQPLFYNGQINIIERPKHRNCGHSDCDGLCDELDSTTFTTKLVFTINGVDYFEKIYTKYCRNGDLIKWREVPTKKYNDFLGENGDYNNDFNNDFSIANASVANFEIVTETFQEKLCKLETKPCGCPLNTTNNINLIRDHCGCFFPLGYWEWGHRERNRNKTVLNDINSNEYGSVKISECGTRLYYIPPKKCDHFYNGKYPEFLLINYQSSGIDCSSQVQVPDFAVESMFAGIDWRSKRFNNKYSLGEKKEAKYEWNDAVNRLTMWLSPLNLQELEKIVDAPVYW